MRGLFSIYLYISNTRTQHTIHTRGTHMKISDDEWLCRASARCSRASGGHHQRAYSHHVLIFIIMHIIMMETNGWQRVSVCVCAVRCVSARCGPYASRLVCLCVVRPSVPHVPCLCVWCVALRRHSRHNHHEREMRVCVCICVFA